MSVIASPRELHLVAQVENRHCKPDLCVIYEPDDEGRSHQSKWITAKGGSFVALDSTR